MNSKYLEGRKWFQVLAGVLSVASVLMCFAVVDPALNTSALGPHLVLLILCAGACSGFERLLTLFLPIILVKLWPAIEPSDPPDV